MHVFTLSTKAWSQPESASGEENFGPPRNLMLACSWVGASRTAPQAVAELAAWLHANPQTR